MFRFLLPAAAAPVLLAGCTTPPPRIAPAAPPPAAAPVPSSADADWRDLPLSPGTWTYATEPAGSAAKFGSAGVPALVIRCDKAARLIHFAISGAAAGSSRVSIRTSYAGRDLPLAASGDGAIEANLPARDPFLDRIAFSRGRVSYAVAGRPLLVVPAWAEPARVIEDCRS